jgi:hypothetical protein
MTNTGEDEIRAALEEALRLYDVDIDDIPELAGVRNSEEDDYSDLIGKSQARIDDLTLKAEEIFRRTGMSREELEAYAANPNNFTKEQWEAIQKVKDACQRYKQEARKQIKDPEYETKVEAQKRKKQPHRFAKKKNWIPL